MDWALEYAPPMPSQLVATLSGLARHADKQGRGAFPSNARLAAYACKSERSVRRDLRDLEDLKLIRKGDQSKANHLPADKRPEVYDLALELRVPGGRAGDDDRTLTSARTLASSRARGRAAREAKKARSAQVPTPERGDVDVRADVDGPPDVDVSAGGRGRPSGGTWTAPEPKDEPTEEPKDSCPPPASESESQSLFDGPDAPIQLTAKQQQDADFDAWYALYPRKEARGKARLAFAAAIKKGVKPDTLIAALHKHRDHWAACKTETKFIPHPTTWLNSERYDDELTTPANRWHGPAPTAPNTMNDEEKKRALRF